jgi:hypothetical protein
MVSSRLEELLGTWQSKYEEKSGWVELRKDNKARLTSAIPPVAVKMSAE